MIQIILASHAAFTEEGVDVHGPAHAVDQYLIRNTIPHIFLKYPIYGGFSSIVIYPNQHKENIGGAKLPISFRPIWEIWTTLVYCFRNRASKPVCIGVDPLNAFSFILAKSLGWVSAVIFYTPDYTAQRFRNVLMNAVYHTIDRFASRRADHMWCVSKRIMAIRKIQGVRPDIIYVVPNTPSLEEVGQVSFQKKDAYHLVMVGNIVQTLDYEFVLESMRSLQKKFLSVTLSIVGSGSYMHNLQKKVAELTLQNCVFFLGQLSHTQVIRLLKTSGIGIALYDGKCSTNLSGDSMKIREYLACGLPVISTGMVETAEVVREFHAGKIVGGDQKSFIRSLTDIWEPRAYKRYVQNALKAAAAYDFDTIIAPLLASFGIQSLKNV